MKNVCGHIEISNFRLHTAGISANQSTVWDIPEIFFETDLWGFFSRVKYEKPI